MRGPKQKYSKQLLLEKGLAYVNEFGMSNLSFRKFATYIGCSTQPIISSFGNLEILILDLGIAIDRFYPLKRNKTQSVRTGFYVR